MNAIYVGYAVAQCLQGGVSASGYSWGYMPAQVRLPVKPWWDRWKTTQSSQERENQKSSSGGEWGRGKGGFFWRGFCVLATRLNPGPPLSDSCL